MQSKLRQPVFALVAPCLLGMLPPSPALAQTSGGSKPPITLPSANENGNNVDGNEETYTRSEDGRPDTVPTPKYKFDPPAQLPTPSKHVSDFVMGDGKVYWMSSDGDANGRGLVAVQEQGTGKIDVLATGLMFPSRVALDEKYVYFADNSGLYTVALADGLRSRILDDYFTGKVVAILPRRGVTFVVGEAMSNGAAAIVRFDPQRNEVQLLWADKNCAQILDAVDDEKSIYIIAYDGKATRVIAVNKRQGRPLVIYSALGHFTAAGKATPWSLAVDQRFLYVSDTLGVVWRSDKLMHSRKQFSRSGTYVEKVTYGSGDAFMTRVGQPSHLILDRTHLFYAESRGIFAVPLSQACKPDRYQSPCGPVQISGRSRDGRFEIVNSGAGHACFEQTSDSILTCSFFDNGGAVRILKPLANDHSGKSKR